MRQWFHLRRRTADLSEDRRTGEGLLEQRPDRLHLHQRDVHAQEDARIAGRATIRPEVGGEAQRSAQARNSSPKRKPKRSESRRRAGQVDHPPSKWMYWNVHVDGLERTHDLIVEREGVFKECILAIRMAKLLGYQVATNTTIYKETDMTKWSTCSTSSRRSCRRAHHFARAMITMRPRKTWSSASNLQPEKFFLTRDMTIEKFKKIEEWGGVLPLFGTPVYLSFWPANAI